MAGWMAGWVVTVSRYSACIIAGCRRELHKVAVVGVMPTAAIMSTFSVNICRHLSGTQFLICTGYRLGRTFHLGCALRVRVRDTGSCRDYGKACFF